MFEKYYRFNKVAGLNIEVDKDGNASYSACLLSITGNQLALDQKITGLNDINELKKHIPAKTIIAVNLVGKGVLIKQTASITSEDELNFASILPNAQERDFYTQLFNSGDKLFVSFIRQQEADKWIAQLKNLDFIPVVFSLGPFVIGQVINQLNIYGQEIVFDNHVIQRDEQLNWITYQYSLSASSAYPFKLENEQIDEALLLPYAAAFQLALYPNIDLIRANHVTLSDQLQKRSDGIKLKVQSATVLVCFFVLLLGNFLLFSYYNSANLKLAGQVGQSVKLANNAESLADSLKAKQQLLAAIGWEGKVDKSIMIDQIAQLLPAEVNWQQVAVDPLGPNPDHGVSQDVFASRQIRINGTSARIIPVNEWIARLKTKSWVKNVQLQSYYFNNELNTGQFVVAINY
ncbi:hypothetical protein [Mucilaginibacter polytrichastri]|uniref:Uncharacterized protein n=1 Tax=Mucilaginibacter polytrichastri TaxID=1302689 RepID=A0A1Q5ZZW4_9SPHI|nr:hypothetical protein [Mucilaginibacter polytrichastri]OKS87289.1 hypothetical protein RG47T_2748 [Mucilaginibacter polytrichastri]SFT18476.1 hypothetical protein SAMN04487890_11511 [Mucilaginibacter polytrichastri]